MTPEALIAYLLTGAGASIDTRSLQPGEVFFALPGTRTHGAAYAGQALSKGAAAVVLPEGYSTDLPLEKVVFHPDPLRLLGEAATIHRRQFSLPLIAIGGSNGKTTTKALLGHLLSAYAPTLITPRSWNNVIGVPLALLRLSAQHRFAVIELGDNHPGEVRMLCEIAQPTMGLITNIGADHLEGYGDLHTNLKTKWELVDYLAGQADTIFFLNVEDELLKRQPLPLGLRVYRYGNGENTLAMGQWELIDWSLSRLRGQLMGEAFSVEIPLWGSYNRLNVLAALLIARMLGLPLAMLLESVRTFQPEAYRSQIFRRGRQVVILDAYNANPSSLAASLSALWETLSPHQQAVLILGQMEELGAYTEEAHQKVIEGLLPHTEKLYGVVLIGRYWEAAIRKKPTFQLVWVKEAKTPEELPSWVWEAPVLYLKGSRSQELERLVKKVGS